MVIHVRTVVQTTFGIVDEAGNLVQTIPVTIEMPAPSPEAFAEACAHLDGVRKDLKQKEGKEHAGNSSDRPSAGSE